MLAPGGLLFCVVDGGISDGGDGEDSEASGGQCEQNEIITLDAQTLQFRHRFGLGLLNDAGQLAVVADELFVCDTGNHRLQVFSLTGEHRRSVTGPWRSPERLCFAKDRLYLVEREYDGGSDGDGGGDGGGGGGGGGGGDDTDVSQEAALRRRRILVLSLQGDVLQVVMHPTEPTAVFTSICCFDHKLLATYYHCVDSAGTRSYEMLALQGL